MADRWVIDFFFWSLWQCRSDSLCVVQDAPECPLITLIVIIFGHFGSRLCLLSREVRTIACERLGPVATAVLRKSWVARV